MYTFIISPYNSQNFKYFWQPKSIFDSKTSNSIFVYRLRDKNYPRLLNKRD